MDPLKVLHVQMGKNNTKHRATKFFAASTKCSISTWKDTHHPYQLFYVWWKVSHSLVGLQKTEKHTLSQDVQLLNSMTLQTYVHIVSPISHVVREIKSINWLRILVFLLFRFYSIVVVVPPRVVDELFLKKMQMDVEADVISVNVDEKQMLSPWQGILSQHRCTLWTSVYIS